MNCLRHWINICEMVFKPSRINLDEEKSFDELYGSKSINYPNVNKNDDLIKSKNVLKAYGWNRIAWKHPLGIFEWAFENPKFKNYRVFLFDLKHWEVVGPNHKTYEGSGWKNLRLYLNQWSKQNDGL
jgi:hypothetical protein